MVRGSALFFFFFSSRRRHTRCLSDWSSDVCSSDLALDRLTLREAIERGAAPILVLFFAAAGASLHLEALATIGALAVGISLVRLEIGRASCRERGELSLCAVSVHGEARMAQSDIRL